MIFWPKHDGDMALPIGAFGYEPTGDNWIDTFMNGRQERISNGIPYVNFRFAI